MTREELHKIKVQKLRIGNSLILVELVSLKYFSGQFQSWNYPVKVLTGIVFVGLFIYGAKLVKEGFAKIKESELIVDKSLGKKALDPKGN